MVQKKSRKSTEISVLRFTEVTVEKRKNYCKSTELFILGLTEVSVNGTEKLQ